MEDLEEWQVLPEDGFLDIHDDGGKKIFSRRYYAASENIFKNYFICPSPEQSSKFVESTEKAVKVPNQFVPVPIQLEAAPAPIQGPQDDQVLKQVPTREINLNKPLPLPEKIRSPEAPEEADQDLVSQVFFKKETEFVDMKMDSPKSNNNNNSSWGIKTPQMVQFQEKGEPFKAPGDEKVDEEEMMKTRTSSMDGHGGVDTEKEVAWDEHSGGLNNIFKWSLTGIGAICSFGVATVCIFAFGGLIKNTNKQHQQNHQKLRFHIYAEDKRLKQVVHHHATKLNEAISAVRGMPLTKAHITFGGYYDAL